MIGTEIPHVAGRHMAMTGVDQDRAAARHMVTGVAAGLATIVVVQAHAAARHMVTDAADLAMTVVGQAHAAVHLTVKGAAGTPEMIDADRPDETISAVVVGRRDVMIEAALTGATGAAAARAFA
jgi:hypothetical protein